MDAVAINIVAKIAEFKNINNLKKRFIGLDCFHTYSKNSEPK